MSELHGNIQQSSAKCSICHFTDFPTCMLIYLPISPVNITVTHITFQVSELRGVCSRAVSGKSEQSGWSAHWAGQDYTHWGDDDDDDYDDDDDDEKPGRVTNWAGQDYAHWGGFHHSYIQPDESQKGQKKWVVLVTESMLFKVQERCQEETLELVNRTTTEEEARCKYFKCLLTKKTYWGGQVKIFQFLKATKIFWRYQVIGWWQKAFVLQCFQNLSLCQKISSFGSWGGSQTSSAIWGGGQRGGEEGRN